jgi:hypothetical protein
MHRDANPVIEIVGRFAERARFKTAVEGLLAAGFSRSDLSVLDTRDSLAASEGPDEAWRRTLAGLVGEVRYIEPLTAAGLILLAAGPVGAAVAGAVAAGLGGMALYELLSEVRATPHTREFAKALENGAVLLWVRADDEAGQRTARAILERAGAADIHIHARSRKAGQTEGGAG